MLTLIATVLALQFVALARAQDEFPGFGCPADHTPCTLADGTPGSCKPLASCAYYWGTKGHSDNCNLSPPNCTMGSDVEGYCCPEVLFEDVLTPDLTDEEPLPINTVKPTDDQVKFCIEQVKSNSSYFEDDKTYERHYNDPSNFKTGVSVSTYNSQFQDWGFCAWFATSVGCCLKNTVPGYKTYATENSLVRLVKYSAFLPTRCQSVCNATDGTKQRCRPQETIDRTRNGECNSFGRNNALFGTYLQSRNRFMPPEYSDGCYEPKKPCPEYPRAIRQCTQPERNVAACGVNQLLPDFGQFVVHDVAHGYTWQGSHSGNNLDCCFGTDGLPSDVPPNPKCGYVDVEGDPFYHKCQGVGCMNLPRVALAPLDGCGAGAAAQTNAATHYLDLSQVYGNYDAEADALRTFKDGMLRMSGGNCCDQQLPISPDQEGCALKACGRCKLCGDARCNEQPGLLTMHILFARAHNFIAYKIKGVNPWWSDQQIYKFSEKFLISWYQHIIYYEYIPLLIGFEKASQFGVIGTTCNYTFDWSFTETAQTREEWAAACGRLHTQVSGVINMKNACYQTIKTDRLVNHFNDPTILEQKSGIDNLLRGKLTTCGAGTDKYFDCQMTSCLLKDRTTYGLDIAAINIARDCEVALPYYHKTWPLCRREKNLTSWDDLIGVMHPDDIECLKNTYVDVFHIPLYVAMLMELKTDCDSMVGPTLQCMTGQQFKYWRVGDFHFYSNDNVWKPEELTEIRKLSFAYLLCETSCIKCVNTFPFKVPGPRNPMICCGDEKKLPRPDWNVFKVEPPPPSPVPSPSPVVSPSPTPEVSPSPTPVVSPSPPSEVSPSPTPEVSPSPTPVVSPSPEVSPLPTTEVSPSPTPVVSPSPSPETSPAP